MSLDVSLRVPGAKIPGRPQIFIRKNGSNVEITREEWDRLCEERGCPGTEPAVFNSEETDVVYSANITHNLGEMAQEAGLYEALWHPESLGKPTAKDITPILAQGIAELANNREKYVKLNPSNGWGNYDDLLVFVVNYHTACLAAPDALVEVSR